MKLRELAELIPNVVVRRDADVEITGIANHRCSVILIMCNEFIVGGEING
ncbi:hypothetical protein [Paenibacillus sp. GCM10027626]